MTHATEIYPLLITVIGILVLLTNIIVEVIKQLIPNDKFPTNIVVVVVAIALTMIAFFSWIQEKGVAAPWYYVVAAIILGFMVSYAAMFGFDKLKEVISRTKHDITVVGEHEPHE